MWLVGIAVTDTDLAEAEGPHGFREDLYSRWAGAPFAGATGVGKATRVGEPSTAGVAPEGVTGRRCWGFAT